MTGLERLQAARTRARQATQEYHSLQQQVEHSEYSMFVAYDTVFREVTELLTNYPVAFLDQVNPSELARILQDVWWVEQNRILRTDDPESLPDANELYCYSFPGATEELWTAFRVAADTLGFYPKTTYPIHVQYRRGQHYTMIRRLHVTDPNLAMRHRDQYTVVLDAVLQQIGTDLVRVFSKTYEVAEYVENGSGTAQWVIYDDQQSVFRPADFTDIRDGSEHPLDFL